MIFDNKDIFQRYYRFYLQTLYGTKVEEANDIQRYIALGNLVRGHAAASWHSTRKETARKQKKQMFYFSLEFLLGRMLSNNMMNLGVYDIVRDGLAEMGVDLETLIDLERDPGLGNGGLGRLAACFMDSLASNNYPGNGNTIRYKNGLFKQLIVDHEQVEVPDQWLDLGNSWEIRRPDKAVEVRFYGKVNIGKNENGDLTFEHVDAQNVKAVPYDMPLIGADTSCTNTLRMWSAEPSEDLPRDIDVRAYFSEVDDLCLNVYPDDSGEKGKLLRIKQEYFFVAAGLHTIVADHYENYGTLDNFAEKNVIQLNDTHPALAIPELLRILMDEYGYNWKDAWEISSHTFAYTNHTVMAEALEKWPIEFIKRVVPRIWLIIEEIDRQYARFVYDRGYDRDFLYRTCVISRNHVRMANLSVIGSFSVNGVAQLHTDILKRDLFKDYYRLFPEKFNNKTNGITPRRWMLYSNPQLKELIERKTGVDLRKDFASIGELIKYVDDPELQQEFLQVKQQRKKILAKFLKDNYDITVDPNSVFDVIAKRLHAYKRQLLDILHVIYLYQRLKDDLSFTIPKTTFIFSAKAASSYRFAKKIIKLINCVAEKIDQDPYVSQFINVVFIPNYRVTVSEKLMNAADISEQISTAGKEASGTGNMKFMMNGAVTLGTLDGANVEIADLVGEDNIVIFGLRTEEVEALRPIYRARDHYENDERIRKAVDALLDCTFSEDPNDFVDIANEFLLRNDEYFILADFAAYADAHEKIYELYQDPSRWARMCLVNIARSAYFSSDRTIEDYVRDIWHIEKL